MGDATAPGKGELVLGRYDLGERIGEGGLAVIYKGWDTRLERPVAIKFLRAQYSADDAFLARFDSEAKAAAGAANANIIDVHDFGQHDGRYCIVMEYVAGKSLKETIAAHGTLPAAQAVEIAIDLCHALSGAHRTGLVHRDVKPQNVMLTEEGNAKLGDFGIARAIASPRLTETGITIGSVHYLSPEQALGLSVTPASDIYSLGIVLFEMLTGTLPFEGQSAVEVALKQVSAPPPSLTEINPFLPAALVEIVDRCLRKDPAHRYRSAAELEEALRCLSGPSVDDTALVATVPPSSEPLAARPKLEPVTSRLQSLPGYGPSVTTAVSDRRRARIPGWLIPVMALLFALAAISVVMLTLPSLLVDRSRAVGPDDEAPVATAPVDAGLVALPTATQRPTSTPTIVATHAPASVPAATPSAAPTQTPLPDVPATPHTPPATVEASTPTATSAPVETPRPALTATPRPAATRAPTVAPASPTPTEIPATPTETPPPTEAPPPPPTETPPPPAQTPASSPTAPPAAEPTAPSETPAPSVEPTVAPSETLTPTSSPAPSP